MFDRFVRFAQARKALADGQFEEALRLAGDPQIREHRKALAVRARALEGLLGRAERRAAAGSLSAALADCGRVLEAAPEHERAAALRNQLTQQAQHGAGRDASLRALCRDARRALAEGDPSAAERILDDTGADGPPAEIEELRQRIRAQRQRATENVGHAAKARRAGDLEPASDRLRRARALDRASAAVATEARALAKALAPRVLDRVERCLADRGVGAARELWQRELAGLPELGEVRSLQSLAAKLENDDRRRIVALLEAGEVAEAVALLRTGGARVGGALAEALGRLVRACALAERGEFASAAELAREVGGQLGIQGIERCSAEWESSAARVQQQLATARQLAVDGRLLEARGLLLEIVREHPNHAAARSQMELLEQGAEDRARRMSEARGLARDGRLKSAAAIAVTLAVPGPEGEEARILLLDVQQRMDTVAAGVRQVLRAMHGRDSATREGLNHCALRLEELAKVQSDADDVVRLRDAVLAEVDGIEALEAARVAWVADDVARVTRELGRLAEARPRLLAPDRLDARALELVDGIVADAERSVATGRPAHADRLVRCVEAWAAGHPQLAARLAEVRTSVSERRAAAGRIAAEVPAALARRDVAEADAALERAREVAMDDPAVERVADEIRALRVRESRLSDVEGLADQRDFDGARRELGRLGPTPSLMRTRIYDLKRNLARAQGLDGAFLLRVDEGGEFLVVRGESMTIGNLRDGTSDLPILASLAGRHARLRRTLSFHGGQEDRIVAERGEVLVDGRSVPDLKLADRQRFRLGASVEIEYRLPSERSLTAILTLRGGFQIAGTDTLLWLKDRGRDGRILIGAGPNVHVPVPSASGVAEVFAGRDGQIRIRCEGPGTIDGRPFQGEHPATAGSIVSCAGMSFVLQPWSRS